MATFVGVTTVAVAPVGAGTASAQSSSIVFSKSTRPKRTIPSAAFKDTTGITKTTVTVGNVSLQTDGIMTGALVGTEAYFNYVNAQGGVNGRHIVVDGADDGYSAANNKALTQAAVTKDAAMVGDMSVYDGYGGQVLQQNADVPDVSVVLDPKTNNLNNVYSPVPLQGGWQEGSLVYFKNEDPSAVKHAAALLANQSSATDAWVGQKATMEHLGYNIVYENLFGLGPTSAEWDSYVLAMKAKGVKMVFIEQSPWFYAAPLIKAMDQEDFHPMMILGASTYSPSLIGQSGGSSAVDGMYLEQNLPLYDGQDASHMSAIKTFNTWVKKTNPSWASGGKIDLFTMYGWLSAQLFTQALRNAGKNPSRGSILQALSKVTNFTGGNLTIPTDPSAGTISNCYLIGRITNGAWVRQADPSINSATNGYRCDHQYYVPSGS